MIHIFNRRELVLTLSMDRQAEIRAILSANGIDYQLKTTNLQNAPLAGSQRARRGSFGIQSEHSYEYKIYVHKKDYEKAKYLMNNLH